MEEAFASFETYPQQQLVIAELQQELRKLEKMVAYREEQKERQHRRQEIEEKKVESGRRKRLKICHYCCCPARICMGESGQDPPPLSSVAATTHPSLPAAFCASSLLSLNCSNGNNIYIMFPPAINNCCTDLSSSAACISSSAPKGSSLNQGEGLCSNCCCSRYVVLRAVLLFECIE
jgi:hypothetical protein